MPFWFRSKLNEYRTSSSRLKKFGPDAGTCWGITFMMNTALDASSQLRKA